MKRELFISGVFCSIFKASHLIGMNKYLLKERMNMGTLTSFNFLLSAIQELWVVHLVSSFPGDGLGFVLWLFGL